MSLIPENLLNKSALEIANYAFIIDGPFGLFYMLLKWLVYVQKLHLLVFALK